VIPFLIGASNYNFWRFLILSSAGAMVWSISISTAGLIFGKVVLLFIADMKHYQLWLFSGLLLLGLGLWAVYRFKHRKQKPESRCQKSEDGGQMTEVRGQKWEVGIRNAEFGKIVQSGKSRVQRL
jgi:hypothetical protein